MDLSAKFEGKTKASSVHSLAHSVNPCLQNCARSSIPVRDALALVKELYNLIQLLPKGLALFNGLKDELAPKNPTMKPLYPTRWTIGSSAIDAVLKNHESLYPELEKIQEDSNGKGRILVLSCHT